MGKIVDKVHKLLNKCYPEMHLMIYGREYDGELFDFKVKTRKWFGRTLAKGDGTLFGLVGQTVSVREGSDELVAGLSDIGFKVFDNRR